MIDHDAVPGPLQRCQITGSADLNLVIDLGHQPPCDSLLSAAALQDPEQTYPLRLLHCPESGLAQLDYVVDGATVYPPSYPYRSGISKPLEIYQRAFAEGAVRLVGLEAGAVVVDIGSNDGTLLTGFKAAGMQVLGVEPTDVAAIARAENGIETIQQFFTEELARRIVADYGTADLVTMTNVFAHMGGLGEVMRGICALLGKDGVFITESHYLLDILEKNQFDTVYHEHIRTYSLKSLCALFPQYGLDVFHAERGVRYGGDIRAYVCRSGARPIDGSVGEILALEDSRGLHEPASWDNWRARVLACRDSFMEFLYRARASGFTVAGKSAPGRASTLLNFYGVTPDLMPYVGELPNSLKLGKYLPGCHLPVVSEQRILDDQPDYLVLLAWHYGDYIVKRLRAAGLRSKFVAPLPNFEMLAG